MPNGDLRRQAEDDIFVRVNGSRYVGSTGEK
jgi:hypothetical protein